MGDSQGNPVNQVNQAIQDKAVVTETVMEPVLDNQVNQVSPEKVMETVTEKVQETVKAMVMVTAMATETVMVPVMVMVPDQDQVVAISVSQIGHLDGKWITLSVLLILWQRLTLTAKYTLGPLVPID